MDEKSNLNNDKWLINIYFPIQTKILKKKSFPDESGIEKEKKIVDEPFR